MIIIHTKYLHNKALLYAEPYFIAYLKPPQLVMAAAALGLLYYFSLKADPDYSI